jgi:hypothetical protein
MQVLHSADYIDIFPITVSFLCILLEVLLDVTVDRTIEKVAKNENPTMFDNYSNQLSQHSGAI